MKKNIGNIWLFSLLLICGILFAKNVSADMMPLELNNPIPDGLLSMSINIFIEFVIVSIVFFACNKRGKVAVIAANVVSYPIMLILYDSSLLKETINSLLPFFIFIESIVVLIEMVIIKLLMKEELSWAKAFKIALLINLVSSIFGIIVKIFMVGIISIITNLISTGHWHEPHKNF